MKWCCRIPTTCGSPRGVQSEDERSRCDAPAEAFQIATGVELLDVIRLGERIVKRSIDEHQVRFTRDELIADGASGGAVDYLVSQVARPLDGSMTR